MTVSYNMYYIYLHDSFSSNIRNLKSSKMEEASGVTSRTGSRGGPGRKQAENVSTKVQRRMATWNKGGLTEVSRQLCSDPGYDILGFTETHDKIQVQSSCFIPAEPAPENDSFAGVAMMISHETLSEANFPPKILQSDKFYLC